MQYPLIIKEKPILINYTYLDFIRHKIKNREISCTIHYFISKYFSGEIVDIFRLYEACNHSSKSSKSILKIDIKVKLALLQKNINTSKLTNWRYNNLPITQQDLDKYNLIQIYDKINIQFKQNIRNLNISLIPGTNILKQKLTYTKLYKAIIGKDGKIYAKFFIKKIPTINPEIERDIYFKYNGLNKIKYLINGIK